MALDVVADFSTILTERGHTVTLRKPTVTIGPSGEVTAVSDADSSVSAIMLKLSDKDRTLLEQGIALRGDIKGYFTAATSVVVGDIIIDDSEDWRVVHTIRRKVDGSDVYLMAVLRRVV